MDSVPDISVVIPVKNEARLIEDCLQGILNQTVPVKEIIVIDSGSTDGTQELVKKFDKTVLVEISSADFNHGTTRNLGVSKAKGEFVIMTVGDAVPSSQNWIEEMLRGFTAEDVAGVCGRQIVPHDLDKNPIEWFRPVNPPQIREYQFTESEWKELSPEKVKEACSWDDVSAMYRKSSLSEIPFEKITYGEDGLWALSVLKKGFKLVYNESAQVYHYHLINDEYMFKRSLTTMYFRYKYFKFIPTSIDSVIIRLARAVKVLWQSNEIGIRRKVYWLNYNLKIHRSLLRSRKLFMKALASGEEELDILHREYCGTPPIPSK